MSKLYAIRVDKRDGFKVVHVRTGKAAFYGTRAECIEWIEHMGNDDSEFAT